MRTSGAAFTVAANGGWNGVTLTCATGKKVISGGATTSSTNTLLTDTYPASDTSWFVAVRNNSTSSATGTPYIICATVT